MLNTTNFNWQGLIDNVLTYGSSIDPRNQATKELLGCKTVIDMRFPVLTIKNRKLGYRFMLAEAAWIMSGDNRVKTIAPFSKAISSFSDDGILFFGAYGPKVRDQLGHVINSLVEDQASRQAVLTIWRENPRKSKDIPCTISCQFIIRNGLVNTFMNMRSSDVWLGVPYDWFNFSMLTYGVCLLLRERGVNVEPGLLHFYAGSQHLYDRNFEEAKTCLDSELVGTYSPADLKEFRDYDHLVEHLWSLANNAPLLCTGPKFLTEIASWQKD